MWITSCKSSFRMLGNIWLLQSQLVGDLDLLVQLFILLAWIREIVVMVMVMVRLDRVNVRTNHA